MTTLNILQDGFFAAIAAIGFASISNPPVRVYSCCAITAAIGHASRYLFMNNSILELHILPASILAAFFVGILSVLLAPKVKCPAESCFAPALLPMIPGMYAYRCVKALLLCLFQQDESAFSHYFYLLASNGLTCVFIVLGMVIGVTVPMFLWKKISFQATR